MGGGTAVYGAIFDEDFNVIHARATEDEEFLKFRGSKYVQSNLGYCLRQVEQDLRSGLSVVFSGTPCQVAAVRKYAEQKKIDTSKLYLIDIICHGTPNPSVWEDYRHWLEERHHSKISSFSFRYQKARWKEYPMMAEYANGHRDVNSYDLRIYNKLFFTHLLMRESCYTCKFANMNRPSDITIGDFWHVKEIVSGFPYGDSTSLVLANTDKGIKLMEQVMRNTQIVIKECFSDDYLKYQHNLNEPTSRPANIDEFWKDYKEHPFEYILQKYAGFGWKDHIKHGLKKGLAEIGLLETIMKMKA